jgi:HEAT repeat protein
VATKKKSRRQRAVAASEPRPLNDEPRGSARNVFPKPTQIDLRAWGAAGVRIMTERALGACHSYGDEVWKLLGVDKSELARRRAEIVAALRSIVADPERSDFVNRDGAVTLLAELGGQGALADLEAILNSPFERRSTRAWAAFGIGRCAGAKGVEVLGRHVANPDALIRRKMIDGLAASRAKEALPILEDVLKRDQDPFVANRAYGAIRRLEKDLKVDPRPLEPRPSPRVGGTTEAVKG